MWAPPVNSTVHMNSIVCFSSDVLVNNTPMNSTQDFLIKTPFPSFKIKSRIFIKQTTKRRKRERRRGKGGEEDHLGNKRIWIQSLSHILTIKLGFGESGS
ncbi:hypothetical protein ACOSQ2_028568 [Xanthoceras sorbifolium]